MSSAATLKDVKRGDSVEVIFGVGDNNAIREHVRNAKKAVSIGAVQEQDDGVRDLANVLGKNTTDSDMPRFSFVGVEGVIYEEVDNSEEYKNRPTVKLIALEKGKGVAITADIIEAGNIASVVIAGQYNALITIGDIEHGYADIVSGVMTSQDQPGPVVIVAQPGSTGEQNCVVHFSGGGAAGGYNGPFLATKESSTSASIGATRPYGDDEKKDLIVIRESDGKTEDIEKTTVDTLTGITESTWIGYQISEDTSGEWTATAIKSTTWPPASPVDFDIYVPVAYVHCADSVITSVIQEHYGIIQVTQPVDNNSDFRGKEKDGNAVVSDGAFLIGGEETNVVGATFDLSVDKYIYAESVRDAAGAWTTNAAIQDSVGAPVADSTTSGVRTLQILVGRINGGEWEQAHLGSILFGNEYKLDPVDVNSDYRGKIVGTDAVIQGGGFLVGGAQTEVTGLTLPLATAVYVYAQADRTAAGDWTVTAALQTSVGAPDEWTEASGVITIKLLIGRITAGAWTQKHVGTIHFGEEQPDGADDLTSDFRGKEVGTDAVIQGGGFLIGKVQTEVTGLTLPLASAVYVYAVANRTSLGVWTVTAALDTNLSPRTAWAESMGVITINFLIGRITGGAWVQKQVGTIHFGDEQPEEDTTYGVEDDGAMAVDSNEEFSVEMDKNCQRGTPGCDHLMIFQETSATSDPNLPISVTLLSYKTATTDTTVHTLSDGTKIALTVTEDCETSLDVSGVAKDNYEYEDCAGEIANVIFATYKDAFFEDGDCIGWKYKGRTATAVTTAPTTPYTTYSSCLAMPGPTTTGIDFDFSTLTLPPTIVDESTNKPAQALLNGGADGTEWTLPSSSGGIRTLLYRMAGPNNALSGYGTDDFELGATVSTRDIALNGTNGGVDLYLSVDMSDGKAFRILHRHRTGTEPAPQHAIKVGSTSGDIATIISGAVDETDALYKIIRDGDFLRAYYNGTLEGSFAITSSSTILKVSIVVTNSPGTARSQTWYGAIKDFYAKDYLGDPMTIDVCS